MKNIVFILFLLIADLATATAQKKANISSPDGRIKFVFELTGGRPIYSVSYRNKTLIEKSALGLIFVDDSFSQELITGDIKITDGLEDYALPAGKTNKVREAYREIVIPLHQRGTPKHTINIRARVFNDGLGFHYEFPPQDNWKNYTLTEENSTFNLTGNLKARVVTSSLKTAHS